MMEFNFIEVLFALSYALDCVEHDLIGVTTNHGKRVAALAMCIGEKLGILAGEEDRQILSACAVMHDCALSEYIQDEFAGSYIAAAGESLPNLGEHCTMGEASMMLMSFDKNKVKDAVLYHHENADGSGPFGKKSEEIPPFARLIQIADTVDAHYDLSWVDEDKRKELKSFLQNNIGILFAKAEARAFLQLIDESDLSTFRNEKIDLYLRSLLPDGSVKCTSGQLMEKSVERYVEKRTLLN